MKMKTAQTNRLTSYGWSGITTTPPYYFLLYQQERVYIMLKKIKYLREILLGLIVVALVALALVTMGTKGAQGTLSGHPVAINKKVEVSQTNGVDYIIIPVNSDLSDVEVVLDTGKEKVNLAMLEDFMEDLDTLIPTEIEYRSTAEEIAFDIRIIISDDLR